MGSVQKRMASLCSVVIGLISTTSGCPSNRASRDDTILVAVSINPLASLARSVGGNRVKILRLVPPGASPHVYEPTPSQVLRMGQADLMVLVGRGLEFWAPDLLSAADNPDLILVDTSEGIEPIDSNHHIWLDPLNAISQAELIRDALARVDPKGAETYEHNASRFIVELRGLDRDIREEIQGWSQHAFVAFHPAWAYFASRYGLEQAAVVEETPGDEPSVADLVHIIQTARRVGARAIFAEPQFPPNAAETIAEESGAQVLFLDPLGGTEAPDDYIAMIRYNVQAMARAMR